MNYSRNMPDWHQYNPTQPSITDVTPNAQNVNSNHYAYISNISRPSLGGHGLSSEGIEKHQNDTNYGGRHYQTLTNISNSPNGTDNNLLPPMVQVPRCIGHNIPSITRNPVTENLNGPVDPRTGSISILNEDLGYRNNQIALSTPVPHLNGPNLNVNSSAGSVGTRNIPINSLPTARQGPSSSFIPCKGLCCNPDPNINYQHWEKYGPYQSNISYRNNIHTGYQAENRRYAGEVNFRKENYDNKEVLGSIPSSVDHRRNYSEYKHIKESMTPRNYPTPSGMLQNYSTQNYNLPGEYQKYPYPVKDYPKMSGMGMQPSEVLKHQEQNFMNQQKYSNKPIQYPNEGTMSKGLPPNNMGTNIMSPQNSYYNLQYSGNMHMEYPRESQDSTDTSMINKVLPPPVQNHSRYQVYQQKIAMQRFCMENHLRELTRIPGYQSHPKYKESVLRYREILKLQQSVNYQSTLQQTSRVTTPINTTVPPISLQFDQNGTLINSNYLPDYSKLQHVINTETSPDNLNKHPNKYNVNISEVENHNIRHPDQISQTQHEKTSSTCEENVQATENFKLQQDVQEQHAEQKTNDCNNYESLNTDAESIGNVQKSSKEFANKPELDVRQFLANWDESEEEDASNSNLPDVVLSNSTPVVIVGYENIDISAKDIQNIQETGQKNFSDKTTIDNQSKEKISVLAGQNYLTMQYASVENTKSLEQATSDNIVKSGSIIHCISNSSDEIPTIHIIDNLKISNVIKVTDSVTTQEENTFFEEGSTSLCTSKEDTLSKVDETAAESTSFETVIGNETEQRSIQDLNSVETLRKQSSFTSDESHNPDDISLPDLPTSECTPISTTLNTPIHSDSEESSEQTEGLTISTNPIEVIQSSPMISFTHSPIKIEPYMVEHSNNQDKVKDKKHGSLEFDFQEVTSGSKNESSNATKHNKHHKVKSSTSNSKKHSKSNEKEQKNTSTIKQAQCKKFPKSSTISKTNELLTATESIALENAEISLSNEIYPSTELNNQNVDITNNMIPLIPGEDTEEPKIPVPPMEGNCLTKIIKTTMPITNLSVNSDEEKLDKEDDPWIQISCDDKGFNSISNPGSPDNVLREKEQESVEDNQSKNSKHLKKLKYSDNHQVQNSDIFNSSDESIETHSNIKNKSSNLISKDDAQKNKSDNQNGDNLTLTPKDKKSPIVKSASSNISDITVQNKEHTFTKSYVTKNTNPNFEIQVANVGIKIKDNDIRRELRESEKDDSSNTLDAIKIEINVSRADCTQRNRRSSVMKINDEIVKQLTINSDDDNEGKLLDDKLYTNKKSDNSIGEDKSEKINSNKDGLVPITKSGSGKEISGIDSTIGITPVKSSKESITNSQTKTMKEFEDIMGNTNVEDDLNQKKSNAKSELDSSSLISDDALKSTKLNYDANASDNCVRNISQSTKNYSSFISHHVSPKNESQIENEKDLVDTWLMMEPLSKRISLHRNEMKDAKSSEISKEMKSSSSRLKTDTTLMSTSKVDFSHGNLSNKNFDFDQFDISEDIPDNPSQKWNATKFDLMFGNSNLYESASGFVNPIFSSVDKLEDLNTVPVYTTKDGKITYSPNPRFTYRELLLETHQREYRSTFQDIFLNDCVYSSNQKANKLYKRKRNLYPGKQSCSNHNEYRCTTKHFDNTSEIKEHSSDKNAACLWKEKECLNDAETNKRNSYSGNPESISFVNKVEPTYDINLDISKSKLLYDVKGCTSKMDNLNYIDLENENILSDAGLFLENKTSYREETRESTCFPYNKKVVEKDFEKKEWSFKDSFPTPSSTVSSQFSFKERISDNYLFNSEKSDMDKLSMRLENKLNKKEFDPEDMFELNELTNPLQMEDMNKLISDEKCKSESTIIMKTSSTVSGRQSETSEKVISRVPTSSDVDNIRKHVSMENEIRSEVSEGQDAFNKNSLLLEDNQREDKDSTVLVQDEFSDLEKIPVIDKHCISTENNDDKLKETEYPFRCKSASPPKLSIEVELDEFAQIETTENCDSMEQKTIDYSQDHLINVEKEFQHEEKSQFSTFDSVVPLLKQAKETELMFKKDEGNSLYELQSPKIQENNKLENDIPIIKENSLNNLDFSSNLTNVNFSRKLTSNASEGDNPIASVMQDKQKDEKFDNLDNTETMPVLPVENLKPYGETEKKSGSPTALKSDNLLKIEKLKFCKRSDPDVRSSKYDCSNYSAASFKNCNTGLKSVPKLVIKKSESNSKIVSELIPSKDSEDDDNSRLRKIPKMIIRNARSRPETPTIEEVSKNTHYIKYSKVEHSTFKIQNKTDAESSSDSEVPLQENSALKMKIIFDDCTPSKTRTKYRETSGSHRKMKRKKNGADLLEVKNDSSLEYKFNNNNNKQSSRYPEYNRETYYESSVSDGTKRRDKSLKLKLRKQNSSRSVSPEVSKRKHVDVSETANKRSKKSGKEDANQDSYMDNALKSISPLANIGEKVPKVIIKRSSASAEFKCEISKDGKGIFSKDVKWQPEVKLERSATLDRIVKELKDSKYSLSLSTLKQFDMLFTNDKFAKTNNKTCNLQRKLSRSNSTSDLSPAKCKQRRMSDYYDNKLSSRIKEEEILLNVDTFETHAQDKPQSVERNVINTDDLSKKVCAIPKLDDTTIQKLQNIKDTEEFSKVSSLSLDIKREMIDNNDTSIEQPRITEFNPDFIKEELDKNQELGTIEADNNSTLEKFSVNQVLDNFEEEKCVIKVDSSDESQTTIEILPASPVVGQNEISLETCKLGGIDYGQLYSEDAIPTQFELELEITDNSSMDPLEVPIPTVHCESNYTNKSERHEFCNVFKSRNSLFNNSKYSRKHRYSLDSAKDSLQEQKLSPGRSLFNSDELANSMNNNKELSQCMKDVTDNFCCNDLLVKEVLAAKDALKKCLSKSSKERKTSKGRPKTAAEKKQGSSFDLGCISDIGEPSRSEETDNKQNPPTKDFHSKSSVVCKLEKRRSKEDINSDIIKKIKLRLPNENEVINNSAVNDTINNQAENFTTISLKNKRYDVKNSNSKSKVLDNTTKRDDCIVYQQESVEDKHNIKRNKIYNSDLKEEESNEEARPNTLQQICRSVEYRYKDRNLKPIEDMPILEPEIVPDFEPGSDRDSSRSPPVITNQNSLDFNKDLEGEMLKKETIALKDKDDVYKTHLSEEGELTIADVVAQLAFHEKATIKSRRYCILCERWFPTAARHRRHLTGYQHRHTELVQRRTVHALFMLFTGKPCPRLLPANIARTDCTPGEPTPLQVAVQDVATCVNNLESNLRKETDIKK